MTHVQAKPGRLNSLTDVAGINVGQAHDKKVKTGVTVVIPDSPVAMGVDVRGGGPGTRETDALQPSCLVDRVHGLVLAGGSVFGLGAADRIATRLSLDGIGLKLGPRHVPVVPSAILFDLKNGGDKDWGDDPLYQNLADDAYDRIGQHIDCGRAGAGFGAVAGDRQGGLGTASFELEDGTIVAAIVAVNSFGIVGPSNDMKSGTVHLPKLGLIGGNTTIGAVATNITLDKAGCQRLAIMAQDGLARTIRPIHTPFDGDTVFAMATGQREVTEPLASTLAVLGTLAADAMAEAVLKAVSAAGK